MALPRPEVFSPDPRQADVLGHAAGPLLVAGAAGTGKTAVLRERFARLLESGGDPERVALVVGSKRARDEARSMLLARLGSSLPDLRVLTIHGLAFRVVNSRFEPLGYDTPPTVLSAEDQFAKVHELLEGEDPAEWRAYGEMLPLRGFADEVRQFLLRAQETLLRPEDIKRKAIGRGLTGWLELASFFRRYLQVLDDQQQVDFAGLVEQAAAAAQAGEPLFDHLLVDDLQDSTLGAEALLVALRPATLVAAGNLDAHVFSFQGFTDVPMRRFEERFAGTRVVELETSHRSDRTEHVAWSTTHSSEEYACIARELRRLHVEDEVPWGELAVVVRRQDTHLAGLLRALDDAGIPRVVPEGGRSLLVESATAPYVLALRWIARPSERDALVEALLTSDLARCSPAEARGMIRAARAAGRPAASASSFPELLSGPDADTVTALHDTLADAERVADRSVLDAFRLLWLGLPSSERLVREASAGSAEAAADLDAVLALSRAIARAGESADASTEAFLAALEAGDEGPGLAAGDGPDGAVRVLTAHGSAGREFDTVLVAGAVEGSFPSLSRAEAMFDLDALEGSESQSQRNRRRLAEERRLFSLVTSRARRRIVFTASDELAPAATLTARSRFVGELGLEWTPAPHGPYDDPLTVAEASATWRRTVADHGAPQGERLAALDGLVALGSDPSSWWFQRDWTDTGRPLRDGKIRVSASRLETLGNCELQFVLGEELGLDTSTSYYAWVGHTVHRIIEDCERGPERGGLERSLEALVVAAEERWREDQFPSRAVSEQFRKLVTSKMLPAWFEEYGGGKTLAAEERFEFAFEDATVAGVIDRIGGVEPDGSQITDYKTGKKQRGDAGENLQLGVYYLAVQEAENLREYLPVRGIELAFVRAVEYWNGEMARLSLTFTSPEQEADYDARVRQTLGELIGRVRAIYETGEIRPNPGANCRFCSFRSLCPLFPEGAPLFPEPRGTEEAIA